MIKYVLSNKDYRKVLRIEETEPRHDEDFCVICEDCLHCCKNDPEPCHEGRKHYWVVYEDE